MRSYSPIKVRKNVWWKVVLIGWGLLTTLAFIALLLDSYRNPQSFYHLSGVSSESVFVLSLGLTMVVGLKNLLRVNKVIRRFLLLACCVFVFVSIIFTFLVHFTPPNYIYNIVALNYTRLFYMAILCGWIFFWSTHSSFRQKFQKEIVFSSGLVLLVVLFIMSLWPYLHFVYMTSEDHVIEYAQFFTLMIGGIYAAVYAWKSRKSKFLAVVYVLISLGLFVVAGDEISWGQRILALTPPAYFQVHNYQNEITFHNLYGFPISIPLIYMVVSLWGSAAWLLVRIFKIKLAFVYLLIPGWYLFPFFFSSFLFNLRINLGQHNLGVWSEPMELMLYLGVCLHVINTYRLGKKLVTQK